MKFFLICLLSAVSFGLYSQSDLLPDNAAKAAGKSYEKVVTPSRGEDSLLQSASQIEKMTLNEIQSAASGDFYQSAGNMKGVDVVTSSALIKTINLRGFSDTRSLRTKQFIDGVDNESPGLNTHVGNMFGINDLDLENVEILSGPFSTIYGANAMQGIISMNSKSPYDYKGLSIQLKGGGTTAMSPYVDAQIRLANTFGKKGKFALKLTGSYTQMKDWQANDTLLNYYGNIHSSVKIASVLNAADSTWLSANPAAAKFDTTATTGYLNFQSPGYMESQLTGGHPRVFKASVGLYYRFSGDIEFSATYRFGYASGIYQGASRYQLKDFYFHQPMVQLKGKSFFARAFVSIEDAGMSYNLASTGNYISGAASSDYTAKFTSTYFNEINTLVGGFANCIGCFEGGNNAWILDSARNVARRGADSAWYKPGSTPFVNAYNKITADRNPTTGSRYFDKPAIGQLEAQYNWDFVNWMDIITGASYKLYLPNSQGTILLDTGDRKIQVHEVGAYIQMTKRLLNDNFRITGSVRADKSSNFGVQVSPRGAMVYTAKGVSSAHTFRVSAGTAFRTPTIQDQYSYIDVGGMKTLGNLDGLSNLYSLQSIYDFQNYYLAHPGDTVNAATLLKPVALSPLKPEQVTSVEIGYRADIRHRVFIDFSTYYSLYKNLIGYTKVAAPNKLSGDSAKVGEASGVANVLNGIYSPYQTWANAEGIIPSWGAAVSVAVYAGRGITPYINYTYSDLDDINLKNSGAIILTGFNTPKHKINIGVNASKVIKGLGFSANWKWVTSYSWQSPFASVKVPGFHTLDVQVSYELPQAYSTFHIGGSNVYDNRHIEAAGAPKIGAFYYLSWTFDLSNFGKKKPGPPIHTIPKHHLYQY